MKTSVYIATQKIHEFPSDARYRPIFLGGTHEEGFQDDMSGDSISERNSFYSELTGLYWIWKNDKESEVMGLCHYRRFLWLHKPSWRIRRKSFDSVYACDALLQADKIETWLQSYDIILPRPDAFRDESLKEHFIRYTGESAYRLMEEALQCVAPECVETFVKVMGRRWGYFANIMIAKREIFQRYCAWLFPILFQIEKHMDKNNAANFRLLGYCSERLLNVFVTYHRLHVKELPQLFIVASKEPLGQSSGIDMRYLKRRYIPWWVEFTDKLCGRRKNREINK